MENFELLDGWSWRRLGDVADGMLGKTPKRAHYSSNGIKVVKFRDVSSRGIAWTNDDAGFVAETSASARDLRYLKQGDVLLTASAHNADSIGKKTCIVADWPDRFDRVAFVGELLCARADTKQVLPGWILGWFLSEQGGVAVSDKVEGVHLTSGRAQDIEIPVPPLAEQRRIVARVEALTRRLDQARQARKSAIADAENMLRWIQQSSYERLLEEHDSIPLSEVGGVVSGGTPSKARTDFWDGDIPWVAPKEMKVFRIGKSSMNVTKLAVTEGGAKIVQKPAVLMVVRGMILAKRVPVAVTTQPLTINQDMKAFTPRKGIEPEFLANMLCGAGEELKGRVAIAGHGTCKLESEEWGSLQIPIPPPEKQRAVVARLDAMRVKLDELQRLQREVEAELASFTPALLAKAFRGEL